MTTRGTVVLLAVAASAVACDGLKKKPRGDDPPPPTVSSAPTITPRVLDPAPLSQFADAGDIDGEPPLVQARSYFESGQIWKARLILESKALSDGATKEETELLGAICNAQGDETCVDKCSAKLGHKLKFDGGAPKTSSPVAGAEHAEPDSDLARARTLHLKKQDKEAHELLAPKVLDGKASKEEVRMLKTICESEGDKMCVALCASKLK